jgi:hypothetical protein
MCRSKTYSKSLIGKLQRTNRYLLRIGTDRSRRRLYNAGLRNGAKRIAKTFNIFFRRKQRLRWG